MLVYRLLEDGGILPKHVSRSIQKKLYCYVYYMCMCWFYKGAIPVLVWLSCSLLIYRLIPAPS